jgi:hypothetical protein
VSNVKQVADRKLSCLISRGLTDLRLWRAFSIITLAIAATPGTTRRTHFCVSTAEDAQRAGLVVPDSGKLKVVRNVQTKRIIKEVAIQGNQDQKNRLYGDFIAS